MAEIIWTARAADGLEQIHIYISGHNPGAAHRVVTGIYDKIQMLKKHPRIGQRSETIADGEVREILYGHYRIAYQIKKEDRIEIIAIFHSAMDIDRYFE